MPRRASREAGRHERFDHATVRTASADLPGRTIEEAGEEAGLVDATDDGIHSHAGGITLGVPARLGSDKWGGSEGCDYSSLPCPQAHGHIANSEHLFLSAWIALLIQWLVSYWIPRYARYFVAFVPPLLFIIAIIVVATTRAGR